MADRIELLKKIQALAERGIGGEKQNAEELLSRLMREYGVTDADLSDEKTSFCTFRYSEGIERRLLSQVIYMVTGQNAYGVVGAGSNRPRKQLGIDCTEAQRLEIEITYEFYREALKAELNVFFKAFCRRNHMYPKVDLTGDPSPDGEMTPEQQDIENRAAMMSLTMERHTMRKMLT